MSGRLAGKIAVVTGAAGGIGAAAVRRFAEEDAQVIAVDLSAEAPSASASGTVSYRAVDVTDGAAVGALFASVHQEFGRLDILFNVVGGSGRKHGDGPVDLCTEEGWDWVLNLNLRSVFLCCKYALPLLREAGGGCIINTASVLGMVGHEAFDTHAYAASKGGVIALSRAMAARYAGERIRVNVLAPGLIRTPMSQRAQADPAVLGMLPELQPLTGDFGLPGDVAEAALYLAGDESRFVTGVVLPVDGGWTTK